MAAPSRRRFRFAPQHRLLPDLRRCHPGNNGGLLEGQQMRMGIHLPQIGRKAGAEAIRRAAIQAEELGFADVWSSEHIIIPRSAPHPPSAIFYDPVLTLTWAAAFTKRVGLGTSVLVLPMRHPLPLAKELATLQNLSEGRLILGAGVGWMEAEFAALGGPFRASLAAYGAAGIEHVLVEPAERALEDWLRAVERIARTTEPLKT